MYIPEQNAVILASIWYVRFNKKRARVKSKMWELRISA